MHRLCSSHSALHGFSAGLLSSSLAVLSPRRLYLSGNLYIPACAGTPDFCHHTLTPHSPLGREIFRCFEENELILS
jgi:hypothetical protein